MFSGFGPGLPFDDIFSDRQRITSCFDVRSSGLLNGLFGPVEQGAANAVSSPAGLVLDSHSLQKRMDPDYHMRRNTT